MSWPDDRQLAVLVQSLRATLDDLELGILDRSAPEGRRRRWSITLADLMARARASTRDGWPTSSGSGRSGRGTGGGPVPALALAPEPPDRLAWRRVNTDLELARTALDRAVRQLADATPANLHPDSPEGGCRVCSRPGKPEPVYRSERCRWCYDFWLRWKVDPAPAILAMRRQGRRITEADIQASIDDDLAG